MFLGTKVGSFVAIVLAVMVVGGAVAVGVPRGSNLTSGSRITLCTDDLKAWIGFTGKFKILHLTPTWPQVFGPSTGVSQWIERRVQLKSPHTRKQREAEDRLVPTVRQECISLISQRVDILQVPTPYVVSSPKSR